MLLESQEIEKYLPLLYKACKTFASHQIRNVATIAGNIINDSPVADLISPLLVLDTKITLASLKGERSFLLEELFDGFKSLKISNEIVLGFEIPLEKGDFYYRKVGGRKQLNISKLSLALFYTQGRFRLSGASLNIYVQRFKNIEKLLESEAYLQDELFEAIDKDISPHSNARYKKRVFYNLLEEALSEIQ
jgi:CO/xanthine dehydrogenase FAD-binding subunit